MSKGVFITATGTDVGKTYVTALIIKKLRENGINSGYYKAVLSGADSISKSDAGFVNRVANIGEREDLLLSYIYKNAVSPHLASKIEGNPVEIDIVKSDFRRVCQSYDFVTVEGSGGIVCPIRDDEKSTIFLEDIIKELNLPTIIVADAGLGAINSVVLTYEYMKSRNIKVNGIILNNYKGGIMENDNIKMIEKITGIPVVSLVKNGDSQLHIDIEILKETYKEI